HGVTGASATVIDAAALIRAVAADRAGLHGHGRAAGKTTVAFDAAPAAGGVGRQVATDCAGDHRHGRTARPTAGVVDAAASGASLSERLSGTSPPEEFGMEG